MNETFVTVCGTVGTEPRRVAGDGWVVTNFRLAHTPRRYDRAQGGWADGQTNWYGVKAFRALANHTAVSLGKGDRVVVHGKLRVDEWRTPEGELRTSMLIEADTIGHDLVFGTSSFIRATQVDRPEAAGQAVADRMLREAEEAARHELLMEELRTAEPENLSVDGFEREYGAEGRLDTEDLAVDGPYEPAVGEDRESGADLRDPFASAGMR